MASIISAGTTSGTSLNLSGDTSGVLQLATNGSTTAMTITTGQLVGIGTASPTHRLQVEGNSGAEVKVTRGTNDCVISLSNNIGGAVYIGPTVASPLVFQTTNTERVRVTTGGYTKMSNSGNYGNVSGSYHELYNDANTEAVVIRNANASFNQEAVVINVDRNTTNNSYYFLRANVPGVGTRLLIADSGAIGTAGSISLGNVTPPTSGIGVQFPATQSASSDANTLDDYEEGTWTPVLTRDGTAPTITYSARPATYVKIGQMVYCMAEIGITSISANGSGLNQITGLPFTAETASGGGFGRWGGFMYQNGALTAADSFYVVGGSTFGFFYNLTNQTNPNANYAASSLWITIVYKASA